MKLGVFSDVHDNIENLKKAREVFENQGVELGLFCGDLVSPFTLKFFEDWSFPIKAVFGNNEGDIWGIVRRLKEYDLDIEYPTYGLFWDLKIKGKKIAVFHGHAPEIIRCLLDSGRYDVVCTGHTHEPGIKEVNNTLWINPGSVTGISENPEIKVGTVAVLDTSAEKAKIVELE